MKKDKDTINDVMENLVLATANSVPTLESDSIPSSALETVIDAPLRISVSDLTNVQVCELD